MRTWLRGCCSGRSRVLLPCREQSELPTWRIPSRRHGLRGVQGEMLDVSANFCWLRWIHAAQTFHSRNTEPACEVQNSALIRADIAISLLNHFRRGLATGGDFTWCRTTQAPSPPRSTGGGQPGKVQTPNDLTATTSTLPGQYLRQGLHIVVAGKGLSEGCLVALAGVCYKPATGRVHL